MTQSERPALVVALPEFTGPLDLLLQLIQRRRLDVTAVSLAAVADQYLAQVLALEGELEALSDFLVVASQLLVIKSRALLPATAPPDDAADTALDLERRLSAYQVLQGAARWLAEREVEGLRSWPRGAPVVLERGEAALAPLSPARLLQAAQRWLAAAPPSPAALETVERPRLADRAAVVLDRLDTARWAPLDALLGHSVPVAVATVLAVLVLVLVRVGALAVRQDEPDGPILLWRLTDDTDVLRRIETWE